MTSLENYSDVESKKYLIIYLDILGYRDIISRIGERELYALVEKTWIAASSFFSAKLEKKDGSTIKFDNGIRMYSDNILIFTRLEDDEWDKLRCSLSISMCAILQFFCLEECNVLLRGAITDGECCIGNYIFGKPFLIAHDMESKRAGWSRVLVSEDTVKKYIPSSVENAIVKRDTDDTYFIDYLTHLISIEYDKPEKILERHRNALVNIARRSFDIETFTKPYSLYHMGELQKIAKKFRQLTTYHNETCDAYNISEKIEEAKVNDNTFTQDYEIFVNLFHKAGIDEMDDLEYAMTRLSISYKLIFESIRRNKQLLDEIDEKLKK